MRDETLDDGAILGTVTRPGAGWGPGPAATLNDLIRHLTVTHDWRHLVVRMHPATWRQVMPYLNYNLSLPKPGIPMEMDRGVFAETDRIEVAYREVVQHPY